MTLLTNLQDDPPASMPGLGQFMGLAGFCQLEDLSNHRLDGYLFFVFQPSTTRFSGGSEPRVRPKYQAIFSQHFLSLLYVTLAFGSLQDSVGQPL
jgi:hypothetical protein